MQIHVNDYGLPVVESSRTQGPALSKTSKHAEHVAIVGGGASAVLLLHALRKNAERPLHVTIVEQRSSAGSGTAYSTPSPSHLLNVPAGRMSADAANADEFVTWLTENVPAEGYTAKSFVPRRLYGAYLRN